MHSLRGYPRPSPTLILSPRSPTRTPHEMHPLHAPSTAHASFTTSEITLPHNQPCHRADAHAYVMLATLDTPIKIRIPITIHIAGSQHQQIAHIQSSPHNTNINARSYTNMYKTPLTQTINSSILLYLQSRGMDIHGRITQRWQTKTRGLSNPLPHK